MRVAVIFAPAVAEPVLLQQQVTVAPPDQLLTVWSITMCTHTLQLLAECTPSLFLRGFHLISRPINNHIYF